MEQRRVFIAGSCRTPMGRAGGILKDFTAVQLLTACFNETMERGKIAREKIDEVIAGQVAQSSDAPNIARVAALMAEIPIQAPAFTVQRNCGSGLQAIASAADRIRAGEADVVLAGGVESMSHIGYRLSGKVRWGGLGYRPGNEHKLVDDLDRGLTDPVTGELMGKTAENIAEKYEINRKDQDEYAARSLQLAFRAQRSGKFQDQIVSLHNKKEIKEDELMPQISAQILAQYPAIFKTSGGVTPGNSCPISDGASSMLVMNEDFAEEHNIQPEAELLSYAFTGCNPSFMGMGPAHAIPLAILKAEIESREKIDVWELNEAFAAQVLACQRELEIPMEKLNVWGGAIAMGHPVGATGAILVTKMIHMLKDMDKKLGMVSMCIGGGQGGAAVLRRI